MTKFKKTKTSIKKNDITITFIKLIIFVFKISLNINKKIKSNSLMFDFIFNEFDEFFLKSKTITAIFNVNLINSFKKISNLNTKFNIL